MVALSDSRWLQGEFYTLVGLFDRVGLQTNVWKKVGMVCRPCQGAGNQLETAYRRRITGEVPTYRERQKVRVHCREFWGEMAAGSMAIHMMTQHGRVADHDGVGKPRPWGKSRGHIEWPSHSRDAHGAARRRDVWAEQRRGRRCGYTSFTGMSWTP